MLLAQGGCRDLHLEMKDAGVAVLEALAVGNHSVQNSLVEGEGGNGSQEPTVPWDRKDPRQACFSDLPRGGRCCVCGMPGATWDSLGRVPFISPPLTEKTQESGRTSTYADSQSLSGPAGGRSWGSAQWNGNGNYNGENAQNPTPGGLPSAPWQMSVRVAPSTMNWGFDISSYKTHGHVPGPVPPRNWYPDTTNNGGTSPIATTIKTKFHPEWPSYRRSLPFDAIGFRGMGTQFLEAQAMRNRREGLVLEEDPTLQASRPQIFIILAQVLDGVFMAAQTQLLVPLLLHLG